MIQLHTHSARANLQEAFASEIRENAGEIFSACMNDDAAEIHRGKPIPMDSTIHPDLQPEFSPM